MSEKLKIPVFVLNMKKDVRRRKEMCAKAQVIGVDLRFIEAIDGKELSEKEISECYDSRKRKRYFGRDLMRQEIGCLLSHRKAYQLIADENIQRAVILEDDIVFDTDFVKTVNKVLSASFSWDVIRFLATKKSFNKGYREVWSLPDNEHKIVRIPTTPGGAYGYMLSNKAARVFLDHMRKNWVPVDALHGQVWKTGLETFALYPAPLNLDAECETTIGSQRFVKNIDLTGLDRVLYPFTRFGLKIYEAAGKRTAYYSSWRRDCKSLRASREKII